MSREFCYRQPLDNFYLITAVVLFFFIITISSKTKLLYLVRHMSSYLSHEYINQCLILFDALTISCQYILLGTKTRSMLCHVCNRHEINLN